MDFTLVQQLATRGLPAPPSNKTLSGTTMAARPFCFSRVLTCWRKLSCLLEVVAQKSSRSIISVSLATLPSSATIVVLLFSERGIGHHDLIAVAGIPGQGIRDHKRKLIASDSV